MHALDRPLVSGLMALEQHFVTAEELIDAFRAWRLQPEGSLGRILAARGKLSEDRVQSLEELYNSSGLQESASLADSNNGATSTGRPVSTSVDERLHSTAATNPSVRNVTVSVRREQADGGARFKPIQLHARGGLGHVFLAEDLELHRKVALKEILPHAADEPASRERFVVEAKITGNLEHPGIVPVYGLGVHDDGRPFYAMRFIQGQTLSEAIKKLHSSGSCDFDSLEFRQLLSRLVNVCNAVAFAHNRGIVHRDLKPQNVMLGPFGETLVVDWGLAKSFGVNESEATLDWRPEWPSNKIPVERQSFTTAGEVIGTPAYMSPEQAAGKAGEVGPVSDVYSLGAILYALLTGQSPRGAESSDILEAVREGNLVLPRQANPHVPRSLSAICQKAMAHEAGQRYRTPLELAADIERWLADEPVLAYREPWTDTAFRWMRKHRLSVVVAGVVLLVTAAALTIGYAIVRKERDIARQERASAVAANQRAQENAAATREVIEQFLLKVGDDRWSQIPGFEDVRLEMVNLAVEKYRALLAQQPDDAGLSADAALAFRRCANLYRMIGKFDPAKNMYDEATKRLQELVVSHPRESRYELRLCETQIDLALMLLRLSGPKAADKPLHEALETAGRLRKLQPTSMPMRLLEARVQMNLAEVLRDLGRNDESYALAGPAAATMQRGAEASASDSPVQLTAPLAALSLAQALGELKRESDATKVLNETLNRLERQLVSRSQDPNLRYLRASVRLQQARNFIAQNLPRDTVQAALAPALAELQQLASEFAKTTSRQRKLAEALTAQAEFEHNGGSREVAASAAARAIEILEQLDRDEGSPAVYQPLLGAAYLVAADVETARGDTAAAKAKLQAALRRLERARELNPEGPRLLDQIRKSEARLAALNP